jgi:thioredoxin 1
MSSSRADLASSKARNSGLFYFDRLLCKAERIRDYDVKMSLSNTRLQCQVFKCNRSISQLDGEWCLENGEIKKIKQKKLEEKIKKVSEAEKRSSETSSGPRHLTDSDFNDVIKEAGTALVDFYADWCGPCRMMTPAVETLAKEYVGKALVAKVNVDNNPIVAQKFGIASIPTFAIFRKGKLAGTIIGAVGKEALKGALDRAIKSA